MTFGFDANQFSAELDIAGANRTGGGSKFPAKKRNTYLEHPGLKVSVGDNGLQYKKPNKQGVLPKNPKLITAVRAVVLDSKFYFSQWGVVDGKNKPVCSSISHTNPDGSEGKGIWQISQYVPAVVEKLNPQGFKGLSCADCKLAKGDEGCKQTGAIHVLITGIDAGPDDDGNETGMQDVDPFIAHIPVSGVGSATAYRNYMISLTKIPDKPAPNTIQAIFTTEENPRMPTKQMLKIHADKPFEGLEQANKLMQDELDRLAAESAKKLEEWKAKNPMKGGKAGGSKADLDDDVPF